MVHECTSLLSTLSAVEDQGCWRTASSVAAIPSLVTALQRHRHEFEIVRSVCSTIANLSLTAPVAEAWRDANGVAAIIGAMRTNRRNAEVQASACEAISSLSQTREASGSAFARAWSTRAHAAPLPRRFAPVRATRISLNRQLALCSTCHCALRRRTNAR